MLNKLSVKTRRQESVAYIRLGDKSGKKILFVHGNVSASGFYLPLMERLKDKYDVIAVDLNGYGQTSPRPINAATAYQDWSEDIDAFADAIGLDKFTICGWSLGGGVVMKYAINHSDRLEKIMFIAPSSPFGFGGTYGEDGKMFDERGIGSAGGFVNQDFLKALAAKDLGDGPSSPRTILNNHYFKPGFRVSRDIEDMFIGEMLETKVGEDYYGGDYAAYDKFPYVLPGTKGTNNSLALQYANVSAIADIPNKPDILWFRGDSDNLVSDQSVYDLPMLGKLGLLPGYPGEDVMPPQPMVSQTRYVFEKYKRNGGHYEEFVLENSGHGCHIEREDDFVRIVREKV